MVEDREKIIDGFEDIYLIGQEGPSFSECSCFLLASEKNVLIESSNSLAVSKIVEDLSEIGIKRLDYIMLTHIHMDHAGGAGFLLDKFPDAEVVVHESGAKHLADPTKLKKSVKRVTGNAFKYFGDMKPIPVENIVPVSGKEKFDLGKGYTIEVVYSPGHAEHHNGYYESKTKSLAVGDVAGRYSPERDLFFPATPPPGFDFERTLETLKELKKLDIDHILYSHEGSADQPYEKLRRYEVELERWVNEIKDISAEKGEKEEVIGDITDRYGGRIAELLGKDDKQIDEEVRHIIGMNVEGVLLYLEKQGHSK